MTLHASSPARPSKRPRLTPTAELTAEADLARQRFLSQDRLKNTWEGIFSRYGRDFEGIADEVDTVTGEIVVDNGHVRGMQDCEEEEEEEEEEGQGEKKLDWQEMVLAERAQRDRERLVPVKEGGREGGGCEKCRYKDELDDSVCRHCSPRKTIGSAADGPKPGLTDSIALGGTPDAQELEHLAAHALALQPRSLHSTPEKPFVHVYTPRTEVIISPRPKRTPSPTMSRKLNPDVRTWNPSRVYNWLKNKGALSDEDLIDVAYIFEKYGITGAVVVDGGVSWDMLKDKLGMVTLGKREELWAGILELKALVSGEPGTRAYESLPQKSLQTEASPGKTSPARTPLRKTSPAKTSSKPTIAVEINTTPRILQGPSPITEDPWAPPPASADPFYSHVWRDEHPDGTPLKFPPRIVDNMFLTPTADGKRGKRKRSVDVDVDVEVEAEEMADVEVRLKMKVVDEGGTPGGAATPTARKTAVVETPAAKIPTATETPATKTTTTRTPAAKIPATKRPAVTNTPATKTPIPRKTPAKTKTPASKKASTRTPRTVSTTVTPGWTTGSISRKNKVHGKSFLGLGGSDNDEDELSASDHAKSSPVPVRTVKKAGEEEGKELEGHKCNGGFCFVCLRLDGEEDDLI